MDASFDIDPEPQSGLIRVRLSGFFTVDDVRAFAQQYREQLRQMAGREHLTLADIREMKIQAQHIVSAFRDFMASPGIGSRKLAFLCGSTLARLQAQRLTDREQGVRFFEDINAAEAWLLN